MLTNQEIYQKKIIELNPKKTKPNHLTKILSLLMFVAVTPLAPELDDGSQKQGRYTKNNNSQL